MTNDIIDTIDRLGQIKAQIADLQAIEKSLSEQLKAQGLGSYEGGLFRATVMEVGSRHTLDTKAAEQKLLEMGVTHQWMTAHRKTVSGYTCVKVSARRTAN